MKAKHASEIRRGLKAAKNFNWMVSYGCSPDMLKITYANTVKRSTLLSLRAFKRKIGTPDAW